MVHKPIDFVHFDMCLVGEMLGVALLGLVGIRATLLLPVLGGTGRRDDGGAHAGPFFRIHSLPSNSDTTWANSFFCQLVLHKQRTKAPDGVSIWCLVIEIQPAEIRKSSAVDDLIYHSHIGQIL